MCLFQEIPNRLLRGIPAAVVGLSVQACIAAVPLSLNLPATLDPIKQALAAGGQQNIVIFGDSLSVNAPQFHSTYSTYFRSALQAAYGNGGTGYQSFSPVTNAGMYSGNWTYGGGNGIDTPPYNSLDGFWVQPGSNAGYGYLTPVSPNLSLQYVAQPGGGQMDLYLQNAAGGHIPLTTLNAASPSGATVVKQVALDLNQPGAASDTIYMHPLGNGPVTVLGSADISSSPGVRLTVAAHGGWTTSDFVERNTTFDQSLRILNPQLAFIMLGQNDQNTPLTAAEFGANIQTMVTRIQGDLPGTKICLISSYNSGAAIMGDYAAAEATLAQTDGIGFINLYAAGGPYSKYVDNNYLVDGIHFNDAGGQYVSNLLSQAFVTDGSSLTVGEPDAFLYAGAALLTMLASPIGRRLRHSRR